MPISIRRRGSRKLVLTADSTKVSTTPVCRHIDRAMVKAIARAFRWRERLENSKYTTIRELAAAEGINESYVARILRLTLLAPDIVESIVEGRQSSEVTLATDGGRAAARSIRCPTSDKSGDRTCAQPNEQSPLGVSRKMC